MLEQAILNALADDDGDIDRSKAFPALAYVVAGLCGSSKKQLPEVLAAEFAGMLQEMVTHLAREPRLLS